MSQAEPIQATFSRDEIEKRINKLYEEEGEVNREFTEKPSIHDLIYDELRNLNGALASVDERLVEVNSLLYDIKIGDRKNYVRGTVTQEDYDKYTESVKDFYVLDDEEPQVKKVKFSKYERHIIYKALGSRASTLRNQIGYSRNNEDENLRDQITKHEDLIRKLKTAR